jgi:hypothetical protein
VEVYLHAFLISAVDGSEWQALCPDHFVPGKEPCYELDKWLAGHKSWIGHCGEGRNLLHLMGTEPQFPDDPADSIITILAQVSQLRMT